MCDVFYLLKKILTRTFFFLKKDLYADEFGTKSFTLHTIVTIFNEMGSKEGCEKSNKKCLMPC